MRAVRQKGTSPELAVRAALESLDISFRVNVRDKPGRPDIWILEDDIPIFVHGCFWHQHQDCKKATMPKTNEDYWTKKFYQNKERDERKMRELHALGYSPFVIWQCQTAGELDLKLLLANLVVAHKHSSQ